MTDETGLRVRLLGERGRFRLDVDLSLPGQGVSVLFGPSGSGKTTLLRGIAGLEPRMQGEVRINGVSWLDDRRRQVVPTCRRALGFVFQDAALFPHLSVRENLCYGLIRSEAQGSLCSLDSVLARLELAPLLERYPGQLSGGEKQRVAIARALLAQPQLLLMDEPMASLDGERKQELLPFLERLHQDLAIPVVYVTHAPEEVLRLADFVALLDRGQILAAGPLEAMLPVLAGRPGFGEEAGPLIMGVIEAHAPLDGLTEVRFEGGRLWFPLLSGSIGQRVRCRIAPTDVSLSRVEPSPSSALNRLEVTVEDLTEGDLGSTVLVRLRVGESQLLSRVTRKSARELEITQGQRLYAQIKATTLGS